MNIFRNLKFRSFAFKRPETKILSQARFYRREKQNYKRFADNEIEKEIRNRRMLYVSVGAGVFGYGYYKTHLDEVVYTGRMRFMSMSPNTEQQLAQGAYSEIMNQFGSAIVPRNAPVQKFVEKVAYKLLQAADANPNEWEIFVIASDTPNAFVLPNKKIFIFTKILDIAKNEDGLATVLGHEIAHVLARHSAEQASKKVVYTALYIITSVIFQMDFGFLANSINSVFFELPNSRQNETEADYSLKPAVFLSYFNHVYSLDEFQVAVMERRAHNTAGARMEQVAGTDSKSFLSTHPSNEQRVAKITEWIPEIKSKYNDDHGFMSFF